MYVNNKHLLIVIMCLTTLFKDVEAVNRGCIELHYDAFKLYSVKMSFGAKVNYNVVMMCLYKLVKCKFSEKLHQHAEALTERTHKLCDGLLLST